jgi:ferredoxin
VSVLDIAGLGELLDVLQRDGRTVVAPVASGAVVTTDVVTSLAELARGHDEQVPGRYRFTSDDDAGVFGPTIPAQGWKRWFHRESTVLVRGHRDEDGVQVESADPEAEPLGLFGIRACDLAGLGVLDRVLTGGRYPDESYVAARADTIVVAAACTSAAATCFCVSTGTGPRPGPGADVVLTPLGSDDAGFLAEALTDSGERLLDAIEQKRAAGGAAIAAASDRVLDAGAAQVRHLDPDEARRLPEQHPRWDDIASRCLTCGNCTLVCPTCFCTSVHDSSDLTGTTFERHREWASCFTLDFSEVHGGQVRSSTTARYRQWLLHKLATWHDQFDSSGCVGCGRCITWCPTGIDLTDEVPMFAEVTP